jgi:DNA repair exonuclease SbcCD ATPase subunit
MQKTYLEIDTDTFLTTLSRVASEDRFKSTIRRVVQDEMFWRQLLDDTRFNYRIDSKLENFKTNLISSVDSRVDNKVRDNLSYSLPGQVAKELNHQMPGYLNNNHQMNLILNDHSERLQDELESVARAILEKIVAEDRYHEINKMYFDAFKLKANIEISNFISDGNRAINQIQAKYQTDLKSLTDNLSKAREQNRRVDNLEDRLKNLNDYTEKLQYYIWGIFGITVGLAGAFFVKSL